MPVVARLMLALIVAFIPVWGGTAAFAAGAYSHYYIARAAVDELRNDPTAPYDLMLALDDPAAVDAFCCGAVSPDLSSLNAKSHHDATTRIPTRLIELARKRLATALDIPRADPDKAERMARARRDLAFAYGWMSHVAADLAVHPIVNAVVGDAYEHTDLGGKALHAAQEVQLDYYVDKVIRRPGERIDYDVPYDLLSAASGVSAASLRASATVIRTKLAAGISWQNATDVDLDALRRRWRSVVKQIVSDTDLYVSSPGSMKDWDIDVGRIGTNDFEKLREQVIEANGGTLPANWGSSYMEWFSRTRGIRADGMRAALVALIHNRPVPREEDDVLAGDLSDDLGPLTLSLDSQPVRAPARNDVSGVKVKRTDTCGDLKVWINGSEIPMSGEFTPRGGGALSIKVMCSDPRRFDWTKTFPPRNITVVKSTPYTFRYKLPNPLSIAETEWTVSDETFTYWTSTPDTVMVQEKSGITCSGVYPTVKNDRFEWIIPLPRTSATAKEDVYTLHIEGSLSYRVIDYLTDGTTQRHSNASFGTSETADIKVTVPTRN